MDVSHDTGSRYFTFAFQHSSASHRCEPDPVGEALAVHLSPENPEFDEPIPMGFNPFRSHGLGAEPKGIVAAAELAATEGLLPYFLIESPAKRQAAQRLGRPPYGLFVVE